MASSSSTTSKRTALTSSESAGSTIASSSSSAGTSGGESGSGFQVPLTHDNLTFGARQEVRLKEIEKKVDEELRKKRRDWNRDVARMREEVIRLLPVERCRDGGDDDVTLEPFVARRRGSTDCLDVRKMRTLFLEYPDGGRRCKLRFDVSGFDEDEVAVTTDGERIIVRAATTPSDDDGVRRREYVRKIEKPKEVDHTKLKSTLTTDGILVVEASMHPVTLNLRKSAGPGSHSPASSSRSSANHNGGGGGGGGSTASLPRSKSSSRAGSPAPPPPPSICPRELLGVPVIRELEGRRRLSLIVDVGPAFTPKEITVIIIKESRLQARSFACALFAAGRGAKYCDKRVCPSVCLSISAHISHKQHIQVSRIFCTFNMAVAWCSIDDSANVTYYRFCWMSPCFT